MLGTVTRCVTYSAVCNAKLTFHRMQRTAEVQEGFTGLASRLEALDDFAVKWTEENEQKPANPDLQQRLAALQE